MSCQLIRSTRYEGGTMAQFVGCIFAFILSVVALEIFTDTPMVEGKKNLYEKLGNVRPKDPVVFVGKNLTLTCTLNDGIEINSSSFYFSRNSKPIPANFTSLLSQRKLRLNYPVLEPAEGDHFRCMLDEKQIASQFVKADYPPEQIEAVDCVVHDWQSLECNWSLPHPYWYIGIQVIQEWTIGSVKKDCPAHTKTNTSCIWPRELSKDTFLTNSIYQLNLTVVSVLKGKTFSKSKHFVIDTSKKVKPDSVRDFQVNEVNKTCVQLIGKISSFRRPQTPVGWYHSQWDEESTWRKASISYIYTGFHSGLHNFTICGLSPFTQYTIRLAMNSKPEGYPSDWSYVNATTSESVPDVAPEMCEGCFMDQGISCNDGRCFHQVRIYWKVNISVYEENLLVFK